MKSKKLKLVPHFPAHLRALSISEQEYEQISGYKVAKGIRDFLLMASPEFFQSLREATEPDPWKFGFAIFHTEENLVIGLCGFAGPPNTEASAELAYSVAPAYQGRGLASEAATALIEFAAVSASIRKLCAHTLAETNASTRVLEKCGFTKIAEKTEPDGTLVWRWEKVLPSCS